MKNKNKLLHFILDFLYPPVCVLCGKLESKGICKNCIKQLEKEAKFHYTNYDTYTKKNTINSPFPFSCHAYLFSYQGSIRNYLLSYKFKDKPYLYKIFVTFMLKNKKMYRLLQSYDIIIPVPIHKKRRGQRGYNQSEIIAKELAEKIKELTYVGDCLQKIKHTVPQSTLSKKERAVYIKDAYILQNEQKINNKKVMILDDIFTTGNTAKECSKLLKQAGAKKICILTIAKD